MLRKAAQREIKLWKAWRHSSRIAWYRFMGLVRRRIMPRFWRLSIRTASRRSVPSNWRREMSRGAAWIVRRIRLVLFVRIVLRRVIMRGIGCSSSETSAAAAIAATPRPGTKTTSAPTTRATILIPKFCLKSCRHRSDRQRNKYSTILPKNWRGIVWDCRTRTTNAWWMACPTTISRKQWSNAYIYWCNSCSSASKSAQVLSIFLANRSILFIWSLKHSLKTAIMKSVVLGYSHLTAKKSKNGFAQSSKCTLNLKACARARLSICACRPTICWTMKLGIRVISFSSNSSKATDSSSTSPWVWPQTTAPLFARPRNPRTTFHRSVCRCSRRTRCLFWFLRMRICEIIF